MKNRVLLKVRTLIKLRNTGQSSFYLLTTWVLSSSWFSISNTRAQANIGGSCLQKCWLGLFSHMSGGYPSPHPFMLGLFWMTVVTPCKTSWCSPVSNNLMPPVCLGRLISLYLDNLWVNTLILKHVESLGVKENCCRPDKLKAIFFNPCRKNKLWLCKILFFFHSVSKKLR